MDQEHLGNPIDVWLLTGCLGAGKTTTLNHLLRSDLLAGKRPALVINEFGQYGVDGKLVEPGDYAKFEINKGSLFCICVKTEFLRTLQEIREAARFDAVLIEATGIAETRDLEQFLSEPHMEDGFRVRANLCVVDAENYTKTAAFLKAAVGQVQWADGILINKADRVSQRDLLILRSILWETNPSADIAVARFGRVEDSFLSRLTHRGRHDQLTSCPPPTIRAVSFKGPQIYDRHQFLGVLEQLGEKLLRLKGNVRFEDGPAYVETVFDRLELKPANGHVSADTYFTAIGWQVDREEMTDLFNQCIMSPFR